MIRVAVASRSFSRHPVLRRELEERYEFVTFNDQGESLKGQELMDFLGGHHRAITGLEVIDDTLLSALPELEVVSKFGVGLDMIDMAAMARHGVGLGWSGGVNKRSVAELTICLIIALLRQVPSASRELRAGNWNRPIGRQLSDRAVGIVGCGHVGKDLVSLLAGFGCRVLAHDILDFPEFYAQHGVEPVSLEELLRRADVVTLHLPLDDTTRLILDGPRLALMRPEAILVNAARGGLVDEAALKGMLEEGRLAGAAFDVFATEPPEDPGLLDLPNFLGTPHIGGHAEEAILAMGRAAIAGLDKPRVPGDGWPLGK